MNTQANPPAIVIDDLVIPVVPSVEHEYTLPTTLVAQGYGVTESTILKHRDRHSDELVEGTHWGWTICPTLGGNQKIIEWTKIGVVTLGFFVRSQQAKRFRRAAAEIVLGRMESEHPFDAAGSISRKIDDFRIGETGTVGELAELCSLHRKLSEGLSIRATRPAKVTPGLILDMIPPDGIAFEELGERVVEATGAPWAFFWQVWTEKIYLGKKSRHILLEDGFVSRVRQ